MKQGKVKWFNTKRGFGFITDDEGEDFFVHYSDIESEGFKNLREGQSVEFETAEDKNGMKAVHVRGI